ncbi:hypothetical protein KH400_19890 [Desertibacillus haloalkaliphilus]|nr:hypothetical protein [Desertibacillus haloalkaliphilus]
MEDLNVTKIDDPGLIQYEIEATPEEAHDLQDLLKEVQTHDLELRNLFTFRHFKDEFLDDDSNEFQNGLDHVYQKLYELGTPKTKQQIEEIHLRNQ